MEVLFTTWMPNSSEVGCTSTCCFPMPVMLREAGLPAALLLIRSVALNVVPAVLPVVGTKSNSMLQLLPGAIGAVKQLELLDDTENGEDPAGVICALPSCSGAPPVFVTVTPPVPWTFKRTVPKLMLVELRLASGAPPIPLRFITEVLEPL